VPGTHALDLPAIPGFLTSLGNSPWICLLGCGDPSPSRWRGRSGLRAF